MTRSVQKGPFVDYKLLKKVAGKKPGDTGVIQTWARRSQIAPEMIGFTFGVHNGKTHIPILVTEEMVGHRLGEFAPSVGLFGMVVSCRRQLMMRGGSRRLLRLVLHLRVRVSNILCVRH